MGDYTYCGQSKASLLQYAVPLVEEAFALDPAHMQEAVRATFGSDVFAWSADYCTKEKIHALTRSALLVRLLASTDD